MKRQTILHPDLVSVNFAAGFRGVGKSIFMSQYDLPSNIAFVDFEDKGKTFDGQLNFGSYFCPVVESGDTGGIALYETSMDYFKSLEYNQFTTVLLDNISPLESAFGAEAVRNRVQYANQYGLDSTKILKNSWGHKKATVNCMIADLCIMLWGKGVQVVVASSHVRDAWAGGTSVPGKYRWKGADKWQDLSTLTLVLQRGRYAPIPEALVVKEQLSVISVPNQLTDAQIAEIMAGGQAHAIRNRLPRKLPRCEMSEIRRYLSRDAAEFTAEETPTQKEIDAFGEKLSREQLGFVMAAKQLEKESERTAIRSGVLALAEQGVKKPAIAKELGLSVKDIRDIMRGAE